MEDTLSVWGDCGIRFLPSQAVTGDATDPSFAQDIYISWENGNYALFAVDTVFDSLVMLDSGQYQTIPGFRLFNVFAF